MVLESEVLEMVSVVRVSWEEPD
jgi:hypothetical protein